MSNVPMPEPVAWRSRYRSDPGMIGHYPWSYVEHALRQTAGNHYEIESLVTAAQAEAYAVAKVREALEAAALIVDLATQHHHVECWSSLETQAAAIRALKGAIEQ